MSAASLLVRFAHTFAETGSSVEVDLDLPAQGIIGVFGPSGSGKTTLLRVLAGLLRVDDAVIHLSQRWQDEGSFMPSHKRRIGYVFQEPSLFPHLTVAGNLQYASKRAASVLKDGPRILELLGIEDLLIRRTASLSGGEQQRVAIARALFSSPKLMILDEPLASLDFNRKQEILPYLLELKSELHIPMVYVSHSAGELASLADWLVVMDQGRVQASGPIQETFSYIAEAAHGESDLAVLIEATVQAKEAEWGLVRVSFPSGELLVRDPGRSQDETLRLRIQARDVSISLNRPADSSILNCLPATIGKIKPGTDESMVLVTAWVGDTRLLANITRRSLAKLELQAGQDVFLQLKSVAILN
jgi:molybdate transport system ATP-binding protein